VRAKKLLQAKQAIMLMEYDAALRVAGPYSLLAGVDEVGRGSMAGPLVAAAVIMPDRICLHGLDDSKALSNTERQCVVRKITQTALCWSVAFVPATYIDEYGLTAANMSAMRQAVTSLRLQPNLVLSDGYLIRNCPFANSALVKGDSISQVIAAASCLAKVVRDQWMQHLGEHEYPGYGWERNAGYATAEHRYALKTMGITPEHRQLFLRKLFSDQITSKDDAECSQGRLSLFG
jgi:ribonuclease HII